MSSFLQTNTSEFHVLFVLNPIYNMQDEMGPHGNSVKQIHSAEEERQKSGKEVELRGSYW